MIAIEARSADDAWKDLAHKVSLFGVFQESRDQPTKELLHVAITITDPRQRVVFARPINPAFAIAEVIWLLAGANDLSFLEFWNPRMRNYSDDGIKLCGAYGERLGSRPRLDASVARKLRHRSVVQAPEDQLKMAYHALKHSSHSRQVVLQIWDCAQDMPNPTPRSKDVPCNLISHLMIRNDKLEWLQVMRSNDLFWGLPYNLIQFTTLQEVLAGWLGVEVGSYTHLSDSLHVYERHWGDLAGIRAQSGEIPMNRADLRVSSYESWEKTFSRLVTGAVELVEHTSSDDLTKVYSDLSDLPLPYLQWVALLTSESLRRNGHPNEAEQLVEYAGPFWSSSWRKWVAATTSGARTEEDLLAALH